MTASGRDLWLAFLPALILSLLLLELIQLPLASSLARRVRSAHRDRVRLLERAVDASDRERRRIAGDLHDGAVQDLTGVALSLEVGARRVEDDPDSAQALRSGAARTRATVRSLRSLLVEIYPPSLQRAGLVAALEDMLAPLEARGIETSLEGRGARAAGRARPRRPGSTAAWRDDEPSLTSSSLSVAARRLALPAAQPRLAAALGLLPASASSAAWERAPWSVLAAGVTSRPLPAMLRLPSRRSSRAPLGGCP